MCTACSQSIGKRRMKRKTHHRRRRAHVRGLSTKDAGSLLVNGVLPGAVGAIVLKKLADSFLPEKQQKYSNYVIGGAGLLAALMINNPMVKAAGLGAATVAAANVGQDLVDGQSKNAGLGLLPPGQPSAYVASQRPRWSPMNGFPGESTKGGVIQQ